LPPQLNTGDLTRYVAENTLGRIGKTKFGAERKRFFFKKAREKARGYPFTSGEEKKCYRWRPRTMRNIRDVTAARIRGCLFFP